MSSSTRSSAASVVAGVLAATVLLAGASFASASPGAASPATGPAAIPAPPAAEIVATANGLRAGTVARMRWWGIHLYDARLHTTAGFDPTDPLASRFMLELTYAREFAGHRIAETSRDEIERLGLGSAAQTKKWLQAMKGIFPDVGPGQRIAGVNLPGEGVVFDVDGRYAGRVDDPAFARAFFAIWLDERTAEPALRRQLLDGAGGLQRVRR